MHKLIRQFVRSYFQYYIFLILVFLVPLTKEYLPILMLLWVLSGIITIRKGIKLPSYKNLILLLFPFLFFVSHLIGLIYSDDLKNGLFDLEVKLSILFIPIVAVFITEKVRVNYRLILKLFVFGNFIASIICLIFAFSNSISIYDLGDTIFEPSYWDATKDLSFFQLVNLRASYFSYSFLSIFHHPTYFSVYIIFSVAILVYLIRSSKKRHLIYYGLIVYFSIFIWLLGSRAGYITYLISFFSFFLIVILKYKKYWIGIGVLMLGVIFTVLILSNSQINKNIKETINIIENSQSLSKDSDVRLWLWKSGIEVFKDHFLFGVGTGDADEFLNNKYREYNLVKADEHSYNAHNQYIDVAVKLGIVGLMILLLWLMGSLFYALKNKHFLLFFFNIILIINLFFEAMLNTIAGVSFVVFFYSLLYSMYNKTDDGQQLESI